MPEQPLSYAQKLEAQFGPKTNDLISLLPVVGPVLGEVSSVMKDLSTLNAGCETTAEVTVAVVKDIVEEAVDEQAMKDLKVDMDVLMYSMNPEIYDDFDADDYQEFQEYATKAEGRAANIGYPAVHMLLQAAAIKIAAAVAVHELDKAGQVVGMTPGGAEKNVKNKVDESLQLLSALEKGLHDELNQLWIACSKRYILGIYRKNQCSRECVVRNAIKTVSSSNAVDINGDCERGCVGWSELFCSKKSPEYTNSPQGGQKRLELERKRITKEIFGMEYYKAKLDLIALRNNKYGGSIGKLPTEKLKVSWSGTSLFDCPEDYINPNRAFMPILMGTVKLMCCSSLTRTVVSHGFLPGIISAETFFTPTQRSNSCRIFTE